jgi:hypothetical protein
VSAVTAVDFGFLYPATCGGGLRGRLLVRSGGALARVLRYPGR